ncbi:DUF1428 domain-containing protein [Alteromonas halophila]|uniref:DUF1428 domain-containing protein n=1 Tax=Alteromonas halophila TaxID=516698 RepID=A0A918JN71_9ALTE|nr:DUF1428 domain-containing protein [Alteromonas halophila]GGW90972.1 hypothetical protein GCM10007391_26610 [Alteromonas halophila]
MDYIDASVVAVPTDNKDKYIEHAKAAAAIFKQYGALRVVESWGDDVPEGKVTSLPMAVKCEQNETVVFSLIVWPSKAMRDKGWENVMKDERLNDFCMPFDGSRMIFGGFQMIVDE